MARPESLAVAGYYPTPQHLIERIAALFSKKTEERGHPVFLDPCAGDGAAVHSLAMSLTGKENDFDLYTCEMEATRYAGLQETLRSNYPSRGKALHGDAFRVSFAKKDKSGVSVLYLNPPYDTDKVHGRLEQRFLDRFASTLTVGGVLLFVVPYYALKASAVLLATQFKGLQCFRFPEEDFNNFKQVVLFAKKSDGLFEPDPKIEALVNAWAQDSTGLPELPWPGDPAITDIPSDEYSYGLDTWTIRSIDLAGLLAKSKPWMQTNRGGSLVPVSGIIPETPVQDLLLRQYPLATPPRPAHIAAGIASGLFNGARLDPTKNGLPPLLVKGVFDREYRTIEEKLNKDGEVRALVQVQQPKLVTTILDLHTHQYHVLRTGTDKSSTLNVASMTVADLIEHYGESMMRVMEKQCPILYDPRRDAESIPLAASPRKLFAAQGHAARAIVKLLGGPKATKRQRQGKAAILLGEIGSGKSTVAAIVGETIGARRPIIMCPPHLLDGWTEQIQAVLPDAVPHVIRTVEDLDKLQTFPKDRTVISIMSREGAKLSHAWAGVGKVCPKCGQSTPTIDLAKKRARCELTTLIPATRLARFVHGMAVKLAPYAPGDFTISNILRSRFDRVRLSILAKRAEKSGPLPFPGVRPGTLDLAVNKLVEMLLEGKGEQARVERALVLALFVAGDEERILNASKKLSAKGGYYERIDRDILFLLPPDSPSQKTGIEALRVQERENKTYYSNYTSFEESVKVTLKADGLKVAGMRVSWETGKPTLDGVGGRSIQAACLAFSAIGSVAYFKWSQPCGEFLYDAIPEPRRVALAKHIVKYHPDTFDMLILDEGHEYATDGSAQERSAHRLTSLGIPTILMTGTIMNGYAESLFTNMWALSADFRREFDRDEAQKFVDRFGYRKRLVEDRDSEGTVIEFGSQSDRVSRSERVIGNAPGVLPLFLLRHLLPLSATLHKSDLAIDLPACKQVKHAIEPSTEQRKRYDRLSQALVKQIKHDQFVPELAGKLWGQLAELPSYLDRATSDTGNTEGGAFEIRYPETAGPASNALVVSEAPLAASIILPKEAWMLDLIDQELAEGRNVMVFCWHVNMLPRIARLISARINAPVPILHADKVATGKRQSWIEKEIVKKDRRVMVCNPVAIQTGLNNLVHFASEIWLENPACNPITMRQAVGRVDRIGQKLETRIHFAIYQGTLQEQLYDLLMQKVAVSVSTDGLDPESALQAAGVGEESYFAGLSIGKQLWRMFAQEEAA